MALRVLHRVLAILHPPTVIEQKLGLSPGCDNPDGPALLVNGNRLE
mgnify:CR=1 FL=1